MSKEFERRLVSALHKYTRKYVVLVNEKKFIENVNKRSVALKMLLTDFQFQKAMELLLKYYKELV